LSELGFKDCEAQLSMCRDGDKNAHHDHGNRLDEIECEANGGDDIRLFKKQVNRTLTDSREKYVVANPSTIGLVTRAARRATTMAV
jgi:hypothetical protein